MGGEIGSKAISSSKIKLKLKLKMSLAKINTTCIQIITNMPNFHIIVYCAPVGHPLGNPEFVYLKKKYFVTISCKDQLTLF